MVPTSLDPAAKSASAAADSKDKKAAPEEKKTAGGSVAPGAAAKAGSANPAASGSGSAGGSLSPFASKGVGTLGGQQQAASSASSPFYALGFNKGAEGSLRDVGGGAGFTGGFEKMDARALQPMGSKGTDARALLASAQAGRASAMGRGGARMLGGGRGGASGRGRAFSQAAAAAREIKGASSFQESQKAYDGGSTAEGSKNPMQNVQPGGPPNNNSPGGTNVLEREVRQNEDVTGPAPTTVAPTHEVTQWKGDMKDAKVSFEVCLASCLGIAALMLWGASLSKHGDALLEQGKASMNPELLQRSADLYNKAAVVFEVAAGLLAAQMVFALRAAYIGWKIQHDFHQTSAGEPLLLGGLVGALFAVAALVSAVLSVLSLKEHAVKVAEYATAAERAQVALAQAEVSRHNAESAAAQAAGDAKAAAVAEAKAAAARAKMMEETAKLREAQANLAAKQKDFTQALANEQSKAKELQQVVDNMKGLDPSKLPEDAYNNWMYSKGTAAQAHTQYVQAQNTLAAAQAEQAKAAAAANSAELTSKLHFSAAQAAEAAAKASADRSTELFAYFDSSKAGATAAVNKFKNLIQVSATINKTTPTLGFLGVARGAGLMLISTGAAAVSFSVATLKADKAPTQRDCVNQVCQESR